MELTRSRVLQPHIIMISVEVPYHMKEDRIMGVRDGASVKFFDHTL